MGLLQKLINYIITEFMWTQSS